MSTDKPEEQSSEKASWRLARPAEDPDKMKRWGIISAQPSEYLIHYRNGKLRTKSSGQGASCFKRPSDTVAIVPTTIKEVFFQANQITRDNVDVRIKGMAFYHIAEPLRIYTRINFSFRERAEEKLASTFADMCRSHAKWLVANMTVEEAIRKRKEEIASTLKAEVERVVAGDGGWGVVIDTIDIQDIFIVSNEIFQALQQDYKSRTQLEAERSRIETERELKKRAIENEKALNFLRIHSEQETKEQEIAYKKQAALLQIAAETETKVQAVRASEKLREAEKEKELREFAIQSQFKVNAIQHQMEQDAARLAADVERARGEAERDRALLEMKRSLEAVQLEFDRFRVEFNNRLAQEKAEAAALCENIKAEQSFRLRQLAVQGETLANDEQARFQRMIREIDNSIRKNRLQEIFITKSLPEIAKSFAAQFGQIRYTQIGGESGASPFGGLASAFNQLLEVAQLHGIDLTALFSGKGKEEKNEE